MISQNGLPAIHPGEFLAEILEDIEMPQAELARKIGVSRMCISHIVNGKRPITAELACLIGKVFGQPPEYWMNLQTTYDLKTAGANLAERLVNIHPIDLSPVMG